MQDVCYNSSVYSPTVYSGSIPFQEFHGCTGTHITGFTITHSPFVRSVQFTYIVNGAEITGARYGETGTTVDTVTLNPEERIIRIDGRYGTILDQLTFTTNQGRTLGPYGADGGGPFTIDNCEPRGVFGYTSQYTSQYYTTTYANLVDQIGFYCAETM